MIIVLDSNEYINYLEKNFEILDEILRNEEITIHVNEIIVKETLRNLNEQKKKEFYSILSRHKIFAYDKGLPIELLNRYKKLGLKKGDIAIAAFCETVEANYLITENRHFLKARKLDKFKVLSLKGFLNKVK